MNTLRTALMAVAVAVASAASAGAALAQAGQGPPLVAQQRTQYPDLTTGEAIYKNVCQGCHMPDAKGAKGAGEYPALAANPKLGAPAYPIMVVVRGQKAMPEFGSALTDAQVAEVVTYIRGNFGNGFKDKVDPASVGPMRPGR